MTSWIRVRKAELDRNRIHAVKMVGQGEFGEVFLATHAIPVDEVGKDDPLRTDGDTKIMRGEFQVNVVSDSSCRNADAYEPRWSCAVLAFLPLSLLPVPLWFVPCIAALSVCSVCSIFLCFFGCAGRQPQL